MTDYTIKVEMNPLKLSDEFISKLRKAIQFLTEKIDKEGERGTYKVQRLHQDLILGVKNEDYVEVHSSGQVLEYRDVQHLSDHLQIPISRFGVQGGHCMVRLFRSGFSE